MFTYLHNSGKPFFRSTPFYGEFFSKVVEGLVNSKDQMRINLLDEQSMM